MDTRDGAAAAASGLVGVTECGRLTYIIGLLIVIHWATTMSTTATFIVATAQITLLLREGRGVIIVNVTTAIRLGCRLLDLAAELLDLDPGKT